MMPARRNYGESEDDYENENEDNKTNYEKENEGKDDGGEDGSEVAKRPSPLGIHEDKLMV